MINDVNIGDIVWMLKDNTPTEVVVVGVTMVFPNLCDETFLRGTYAVYVLELHKYAELIDWGVIQEPPIITTLEAIFYNKADVRFSTYSQELAE